MSDIARKSNAPRPDVHRQAVVSAVIPCLDEEAAIATVVTAVRAQNVSEVVVVDGGSRDRTVDQATAAGARVIVEARRGYGRAIQAGIAAVRVTAIAALDSMATAAILRNLSPNCSHRSS